MAIEQTASDVVAGPSLLERPTTPVTKVGKPKKRVRKRTKGNKNYLRGRAFEYRVKHFLEKRGYHCHRAWASKGCYDLVAIKFAPGVPLPASRVLFIQCKMGKKGKIQKWEKDALLRLATYTGGIPVSAICREKRAPIQFRDLRGIEEWNDFRP